MGRFLITSLPRGRTAWLAALLTAHGAPCLHEAAIAYGRPMPLDDIFADGYLGIVDPGAAVIYRDTLEAAFADCPTVLIRRDPGEAKAAFETWLGRPVAGWHKAEEGIAWFEDHFKPLVVDFEDLEYPAAAEKIIEHVTSRPFDERVWRLFDTLKIEQHRTKAEARMRAFTWLS